jgi:hypothetical protein
MSHIQEQTHGRPCPNCGEINSAERMLCSACSAQMALDISQERGRRSLSVAIKRALWEQRWGQYGTAVAVVVGLSWLLMAFLGGGLLEIWIARADAHKWYFTALIGVGMLLLPVYVHALIEIKRPRSGGEPETDSVAKPPWAISLAISILTVVTGITAFVAATAGFFCIVCTGVRPAQGDPFTDNYMMTTVINVAVAVGAVAGIVTVLALGWLLRPKGK